MAKRALLAAVNDYKDIGDLRGCINDVTNLRNILRNYYGFQNADIRMITDNRATKHNILSRLATLVAKSLPGDTLVFQFSGHGSQLLDRNGDELEDQMDELICPWDMNWDDGFIIDDTLDEIFSKLTSGVHLEVFMDSCHSGTGLKDLTFGRPDNLGPPKSITPDIKDKYLQPPIDIRSRHEGEENLLAQTNKFKAKTKGSILWSGCASDQTSADAHIDGSYNGAFTYYLCKHIRNADGKIKRRALIERVRDSLKHNGYTQIPQLNISDNIESYTSGYFLEPIVIDNSELLSIDDNIIVEIGD